MENKICIGCQKKGELFRNISYGPFGICWSCYQSNENHLDKMERLTGAILGQ